jgi:hypothetical protein
MCMRGRSILQRSAENQPIYIVRKDHGDIIVQVGPALRKSEQNGDPDHVTPGPQQRTPHLVTFAATIHIFILRRYLLHSTPQLRPRRTSNPPHHRSALYSTADAIVQERVPRGLPFQVESAASFPTPPKRAAPCAGTVLCGRCHLVLVWKGSRTPLCHFDISLVTFLFDFYLANGNRTTPPFR